jgi:hypothetical protein
LWRIGVACYQLWARNHDILGRLHQSYGVRASSHPASLWIWWLYADSADLWLRGLALRVSIQPIAALYSATCGNFGFSSVSLFWSFDLAREVPNHVIKDVYPSFSQHAFFFSEINTRLEARYWIYFCDIRILFFPSIFFARKAHHVDYPYCAFPIQIWRRRWCRSRGMSISLIMLSRGSFMNTPHTSDL